MYAELSRFGVANSSELHHWRYIDEYIGTLLREKNAINYAQIETNANASSYSFSDGLERVGSGKCVSNSPDL